MNGIRQGGLVAAREIRERLRSPVFYLSLALMAVVVAGAIVLPSFLDDDAGTQHVAVAGSVPEQLIDAIESQGDAVGADIRIHRYDGATAGEQAVRDGEVDVLVLDGQLLEWRRASDEQLQTIITSAIQRVAVEERATAAGIDPEQLLGIVAPVAVESVELGQVAGRSSDDETATYILSLVLFFSVSMYGGMVLSGVVEEKSSRVVEVLLARIPSRSLLAGKIAGIGLLGFTQVAVTGAVALAAVGVSDFADIPAVSRSVIIWAVVWFVLGYALFATAFGALGSLASRSEDASSVTGPLTVAMVAGYFVSFASIGSPDAVWARLASWFPVTAPFAMPNRIAMGAASWWDPLLAGALTLAAIVGLVVLGGRVYTHAILHTGGTLKLGEAWQGTPAAIATGGTHPSLMAARWVSVVPIGIAAAAGAAAIAISSDVVLGLTVAAASYVVASKTLQARKHRRP